jgi:hypothetical protein
MESPNSLRGGGGKGKTSEEQGEEHLIVFFVNKRTVHKEFVPAGQTVNYAHYCDVLCGCAKYAKNLPRTPATKELAVASQQHTVSYFRFS